MAGFLQFLWRVETERVAGGGLRVENLSFWAVSVESAGAIGGLQQLWGDPKGLEGLEVISRDSVRE